MQGFKVPQTPLKQVNRGGGVRQEAAQGIPAGGRNSRMTGLGVTEGGAVCSLKEIQETEPASVRAPRAWHQLPGRTESSPDSPGEDRPQDKTKVNTRCTLGGITALQRRGWSQHSAGKELLALTNPLRLRSGDKTREKNWQER